MRAPLLLAGASLVVLTCVAGCAQTRPAAAPSSAPSSAPPATSAPAPSPSAVPPSSPATPPVSSSRKTTTTTASEAAPTGGDCGTVPAASGLTLQVLDSSSMGVPCAGATRLVGEFQRQIAGKQPAGSNEPVSATVDGWLCVSGPPAAQGGTSCSLDQKTVFARVASE
ncbi:MAG TPA: hypothetical protein VHC18_10435 [Amycolatopsis sp.]|nr:hypothetical protein [Amycolatopsis sp.]